MNLLRQKHISLWTCFVTRLFHCELVSLEVYFIVNLLRQKHISLWICVGRSLFHENVFRHSHYCYWHWLSEIPEIHCYKHILLWICLVRRTFHCKLASLQTHLIVNLFRKKHITRLLAHFIVNCEFVSLEAHSIASLHARFIEKTLR